MITLNIGIGRIEIQKIEFDNPWELNRFIGVEIENIGLDCVWLFSGANGEIMVTESIEKIIFGVQHNFFADFKKDDNFDSEFHIHEYSSYEDAYKVALDMREPNPKCYN